MILANFPWVRLFLWAFILVTALFGGPSVHAKTDTATATPQKRHVTSFADFELYMISHVDQVVALGLELHRAFPEHFSEVHPELLKEFLKLHDLAKLEDSRVFRRRFMYHRGALSLINRLFDAYGRNPRQMTKAQARHFEEGIIELNRIDREIGMRFFENHDLLDSDGNPNEMARALLRIESVADKVSRAMNPVSKEEFGRVLLPASEFLTDPVEIKMARHLEAQAVYWAVTEGMHPLLEGQARPPLLSRRVLCRALLPSLL